MHVLIKYDIKIAVLQLLNFQIMKRSSGNEKNLQHAIHKSSIAHIIGNPVKQM